MLQCRCGEGNGNSLQYSCLGSLMDRGSWQATVKELDMTEHAHTHKVDEPKNVMLSEGSQMQKVTHCTISFM